MKWKALVLLSAFGLGGCIDTESNSSDEFTGEVEPNNFIESPQLVELDNTGDVAHERIGGVVDEEHDPSDVYRFTFQKPTGVYLLNIGDDGPPFHNSVLVSIYEDEKLILSGSNNYDELVFLLTLHRFSTYTVAITSQQKINRYVINLEGYFYPEQFEETQFSDGRADGAYWYFTERSNTGVYKNDPINPGLCMQGGFSSSEGAEEFLLGSDYQLGTCKENRGSDIFAFCGLGNFLAGEERQPLISVDSIEKLYFTLPLDITEATTMCAELKGSFFHSNLMNSY